MQITLNRWTLGTESYTLHYMVEFIILFACVNAYLIGTIPFGLILGKLTGHGDIRSKGSGNIGATNMVRIGGKKLGALTLLLDMLKGSIGVIIGIIATNYLGETIVFFDNPHIDRLLPLLTGLCAMLGHCFPVWLKFKGGKGVATAIGITAAWHWPLAVIFIILWLAVFIATKISSLSALIASLFLPVYALFALPTPYFPYILMISLLIYSKHKDNIKRLLRGEEHAFSLKSNE